MRHGWLADRLNKILAACLLGDLKVTKFALIPFDFLRLRISLHQPGSAVRN